MDNLVQIGFESTPRAQLKNPSLVWLQSGLYGLISRRKTETSLLRSDWARSDKDRDNWFLMDGPWQLVSVRDLFRVPGSGSHTVSAWPLHNHTEVWGHLKWCVKTPIFRSTARTLQHVIKKQPVDEKHLYVCTDVCTQHNNNLPNDTWFWVQLVIRTMSSAKRNEERGNKRNMQHPCFCETH